MFFARKSNAEAELAFAETRKFALSLMNDRELFPDSVPAGISIVSIGFCSFLLAGFLNKAEVAKDMIEIYKKERKRELSKGNLDDMLEIINATYQETREQAIAIQEEHEDITDIVFLLGVFFADSLKTKKETQAYNKVACAIANFLVQLK